MLVNPIQGDMRFGSIRTSDADIPRWETAYVGDP